MEFQELINKACELADALEEDGWMEEAETIDALIHAVVFGDVENK